MNFVNMKFHGALASDLRSDDLAWICRCWRLMPADDCDLARAELRRRAARSRQAWRARFARVQRQPYLNPEVRLPDVA